MTDPTCDRNPDWIDWNDTQGYRKITNINNASLTWLDWEWGENPYQNLIKRDKNNTQKDDTPTGSYTLSSEPQYLWHYDDVNNDLRISQSSPIGDTPDYPKNSTNCTTNVDADSSIKGCANQGGSCESKCRIGSMNLQPLSSSIPISTTYKNTVGYSKEANNNAWFYDKSGVRGYEGGFCDNFKAVPWDLISREPTPMTVSVPPREADVRKWTDVSSFSCKDMNHESYNPVKYIDEINALRCCAKDKDTVDGTICAGTSFDPRSTDGLCSSLITDYCRDKWNTADTCNGALCQAYIANATASSTDAIQETVFNYITSRSPQDYISYDLRNNSNADNYSKVYYSQGNCPAKKPSTCTADSTDPCCRDDSTNPDRFFPESMPYLCGSDPAACGKILQYFCQPHTLEDVRSDSVLNDLCGCYLKNKDDQTPYTSPFVGGTPIVLDDPTPPPKSQYYGVTGFECDPICTLAKLQNNVKGKCASNTCVIDGFTVNKINSSDGNITLNQNCGPESSCYITDAVINEINTTGDDSININQRCGECWEYNPVNDTYMSIECESLKSTGDSSGSGSTGTGDGKGGTGSKQNDNESWLSKNKFVLIYLGLFIGVLCFLLYAINKSKTKK